MNFTLEAYTYHLCFKSKSLELDPKIENADIREKETDFKIKSND